MKHFYILIVAGGMLLQNRTAFTQQPQALAPGAAAPTAGNRSEEHTSELQSHVNLVCRLLLEKKKDLRYSVPFRTLRRDRSRSPAICDRVFRRSSWSQWRSPPGRPRTGVATCVFGRLGT